MYRLIWHVPIWILFLALRTLLILAGWVTVPIAVLFKAYEPYMGADGVGTPRLQYRFTWRAMWIWDNQEDGIANDTYVKMPTLGLQIIYWSCFRNPANNLRYVPYLSCKLDPAKIGFIGNMGGHLDSHMSPTIATLYDSNLCDFWYFAFQGLYSNFRVQFLIGDSRYRFWIGFKIFPHDVYGIAPNDYRSGTAGFATQFKRLN